MGPAWKVWNTSYFMYMAVLASMIHGFTVPAGIEIGQRLRGVGQGVFGWLRHAPWGDPGFAALALSLSVFGFVGGITGVTFGTEQINIIAHNTLRIPGHFHATVVSGTALSFMGITYYLIPLIFRREVAFWPLARIQPWIFASGMFVFSIAMTFAGTFGVPRRHWDISFTGAPFAVEFSPAVDLVIGVMSLGGLLGIIGGALYIIVTVTSVFFGRRLAPGESGLGAVGRGLPPGIVRPPRPLTEADGDAALPSSALGHAPGTMVLVIVFLLSFVTYYFVNWKLLSDVWKVG
jgi:cytochrome c oxidase subunit 1